MRTKTQLWVFFLIVTLPITGMWSPSTSTIPSDEVDWWQSQLWSEHDEGNSSNQSSDSNDSNETEGPATWARLALGGDFTSSSAVAGEWVAFLASDLSHGSNLLNDSNLRLDEQIDLHLGDNDSNLTASEWQLFSDLFQAQNITNLDGRVWLDDNSFTSEFGLNISAVAINAEFPQSVGNNSSWTWNESGNFSSSRSFIPLGLLSVNQGNGVLLNVPLTVITTSPVEYRWSPDKVAVNGTPTEFTVLQNSTVSGTFSVTIAENTAPVVGISSPDTQVVAIRWDIPTVFSGSVVDAGIGSYQCQWNFSTPSGYIHMSGQEVILEPHTVTEWTAGEYMRANFSCTDFHGAATWFDKTWGLDANAPVITWVNATVGCGADDLEIGEENILDCSTISVPAGERFSIHATVGDDFTSLPSSLWTSDKSIDWWQSGNMISIVFYQGPQVNGYDDELPDRHNRKENSTYQLNLSVTDAAGHSVNRTWEVRLFDNTPPNTKIQMWVNQTLVTGSSPARIGDTIRVDLNESFDDIDAITDVRWWASLDSTPIEGLQDVGWDAIRDFEIGPLGVGFHQLNISAEDTSGNQAHNHNYDLKVFPRTILDLSIVNVTVVEADEWVVAPGEVAAIVWVENEGDLVAGFRVCSLSQCSNQTAMAASPDGPGFSSHYVMFDLQEGEELVIRIEWEDAEGNSHSISHATNVVAGQPYSTVEWFGIIVAVLGVAGLIYWLKKRGNN